MSKYTLIPIDAIIDTDGSSISDIHLVIRYKIESEMIEKISKFIRDSVSMCLMIIDTKKETIFDNSNIKVAYPDTNGKFIIRIVFRKDITFRE